MTDFKKELMAYVLWVLLMLPIVIFPVMNMVKDRKKR